MFPSVFVIHTVMFTGEQNAYVSEDTETELTAELSIQTREHINVLIEQ